MFNVTINERIFSIRALSAKDCDAYRALRNRIYQSKDALYFSDSFERERALSEQQWPDWCTEKDEHCILGTFCESELVGIIMITRQGTTGSPIVEWEAAWLDPRFRRTGAGTYAYQQAQRWSKEHGYKFVAGFIRATYTPALDICKKLGFVYVYTTHDELWADGSIADTHAYLLDLRGNQYDSTLMSTEERFEEAYPYLLSGLHAPSTEETISVSDNSFLPLTKSVPVNWHRIKA